MYASVEILLEQRDNVLTVPAAAIIREGAETFCATITNGKVNRVPVKLGLRVGEDVEVSSGLDDSQTVVLARAATLQTGQPIEIIEQKK